MLRNVVVNSIAYFYPVGNTPAVCLTQDIPPELDADILLLGCGDARNILHTIYADAGSSQRRIDISCCDIEPAILARNILLFSFLADQDENDDLSLIWNIYYHLRLDEASWHLLNDQLRKLCGFSNDIESWRQCKYGRFIHFCNGRTFDKIRSLWLSWISPTDPESRKTYNNHIEAEIKRANDFRQRVMGDAFPVTGIRAAAPVGPEVFSDLLNLYNRFWANGSTLNNSKPDQLPVFGNPTFHSRLNKSLMLHYGTDPLLGFHLATAYVPLSKTTPWYFEGRTLNDEERVVKAAQLEFTRWGQAFRQRDKDTIQLRCFVGDALALGFSLQQLNADQNTTCPNWYCDPWTFHQIQFDEADYKRLSSRAPTSFNVIDSSNLVDHLGPINILLATAPLLKKQPTSALYTEILVQHEKGAEEMLQSFLCGDFATMALLLGLVPVEYWTNATAVANAQEGLVEAVYNIVPETDKRHRLSEARQLRSRICWRHELPKGRLAQETPQISFNETELAKLLYEVYLKMFCHEDLTTMISNLGSQSMAKISNPYYNRASFVMLLHFLRGRLLGNWHDILDYLIDNIERDTRLMVGRNYIQELYLHLNVTDLLHVSTFGPEFTKYCPNAQLSTIVSWRNIPPVVCVTFEIPRASFKQLANIEPLKLGTPSMCCTMESPSSTSNAWSNNFAAVQLGFGRIKVTGNHEDDQYAITIMEDCETWTGTSNLVVSFLAPTWVVLQEPKRARLSLNIQSTPHAAMLFSSLFPNLQIYQTTLRSKDVHITRYMPNLQGHALERSSNGSQHSETSALKVTDVKGSLSANLSSDCTRVTSLTYRMSMVTNGTKMLLADKSTNVEISQMDASSIRISIGKKRLEHEALFSVPVMGNNTKTRIARKSGYVEIVVPLACSAASDRLPEFMFPLSLSLQPNPKAFLPLNWNMPSLNLDRLPVLDVEHKSKMKWLITHTTLMFSSRERKIREANMPNSGTLSLETDARSDFKDGLFSLFMHFSGLQGGKTYAFGLNQPETGGVQILIFISVMRLDLGNSTVILDAAVMPLNHDIIRKPLLQTLLASLQTDGLLCAIKVTTLELELWKKALPAFVERCRSPYGWSHHPTRCEYISAPPFRHKDEPHDHNKYRSPLCSCGIGQGIPSNFIQGSKVPKLNQVLQQFATRAAISPCFAVSYVEDHFAALRDIVSSAPTPKPSLANSSASDATAATTRTVDQLQHLQERRRQHIETASCRTGCQNCGRENAKPTTSSANVGAGVASTGALLKCGRCRSVSYCSTECQRQDWKAHRAVCGKKDPGQK